MQKLSNSNITIQRGRLVAFKGRLQKLLKLLKSAFECYHVVNVGIRENVTCPLSALVGSYRELLRSELTYLLSYLLAPLHLHACGRPL